VDVSVPRRVGRRLNVAGFQVCFPKPKLTRIRICVQIKHKLLFITWWSNLRCEKTTRWSPRPNLSASMSLQDVAVDRTPTAA
jgi:hypothetical protein